MVNEAVRQQQRQNWLTVDAISINCCRNLCHAVPARQINSFFFFLPGINCILDSTGLAELNALKIVEIT